MRDEQDYELEKMQKKDGIVNDKNYSNTETNYEFWADKAGQKDIEESLHETKETLMAGDNEEKPKKVMSMKKIIAISAALGIIVIVAISGAYIHSLKAQGKDIDILKSGNVTSLEKTNVTEGNIVAVNDVSDIATMAMASIVSITETYTANANDIFFGMYSQEQKGSGSGIIIGENDDELFIATNNHVVDGAEKIEVKFVDDQVVKGTVKGKDSSQDLAVVSVKKSGIKKATLNKIKIAVIGESSSVKTGDTVVAIGNALGYGQSVTYGYISAVDREITIDSLTMNVLQTDAAINPGNSGGALLNTDGEVIGINSAKFSSTEVEGMGYAIPITKAKSILDELVNTVVYADNEKGFLGIKGTTVTEDEKEMYGYPVGVFVYSLIEDGAAKKAGILERDIITKIDDYEVKDIDALVNRIATYPKESKATITLMRLEDGEYVEKKVDVILTGVIDTDNKKSTNGNEGDKSDKKDKSDNKYIPKIPSTLP